MDRRNKFIGLGFLLLAVAPLQGAMPRCCFYEHNDEGLRPRREIELERQKDLTEKINHRLARVDTWIKQGKFDRIQRELQLVLHPEKTLTMPEDVRPVLKSETYQFRLIERIWKVFRKTHFIETLAEPINSIIGRMSQEHQDMINQRTNFEFHWM